MLLNYNHRKNSDNTGSPARGAMLGVPESDNRKIYYIITYSNKTYMKD